MADHNIKTVTLSDGRIAIVKRPKAGDFINARRCVPQEDKDNNYALSCAVVAQVTTIDGNPIVFEDARELYADDLEELAKAVQTGFLLSRSTPSSSSSSTDSTSSK